MSPPYPSDYKTTFAFSSFLYPLHHPSFLRPRYQLSWDVWGLPSFRCSTFNKTLREALSSDRAVNDKGDRIHYPFLTVYLLVLVYQILSPSYNDEVYHTLTLVSHRFCSYHAALVYLEAVGKLSLSLHTPPLPVTHGKVAIHGHFVSSFQQ